MLLNNYDLAFCTVYTLKHRIQLCRDINSKNRF